MSNVVKVVQMMYWITLQPLALILVRKRRITLSPSDFDPGRHYVIAANHQSQADHFLVGACLPFGAAYKVSPLRYLAHNGLFKNLFIHLLVLLGGAFPTRPHSRYSHGLDTAFYFLENNQSVMIFPEGRRSPYKSAQPRSGVAELAKFPNTDIIPVQILWRRRGLWRDCHMAIGKPVHASGKTAQEIMEIIHGL